MMVLFRVIDRKCVTSTGSTGEVEESVQLSHHSMTEDPYVHAMVLKSGVWCFFGEAYTVERV